MVDAGYDLDTCTAALDKAQQTQSDVSDKQESLAATVQALSTAAGELASAQPTTTPSPNPSSSPTAPSSPHPSPTTTKKPNPSRSNPSRSNPSQSSSSQKRPGSSSGGSSSGSGKQNNTNSANSQSSKSGQGGQSGQTTSVASATASVAKAKLALTQAELDLDHATLLAPIDGTVATQPFTKGGSMSTSDAIEIVGRGAVQLTIDVSEDAIHSVKVGQRASVSPSPGTVYPAKVTAISLLPADSTSSSATYPVTLTIDAATVKKHRTALASGVSATATITVASAHNAVLVPVSAVRPTGEGTGTVTVVSGSNATVQQVQLGVMDSTHVQLTGGVTAGTTVSLADTTAALPTTSTTTTRRGGSSLTGGGGFGGGGFGGGGTGSGTRRGGG